MRGYLNALNTGMLYPSLVSARLNSTIQKHSFCGVSERIDPFSIPWKESIFTFESKYKENTLINSKIIFIINLINTNLTPFPMCLSLVQPKEVLIHQETCNLVSVFSFLNSEPVLGRKSREIMTLSLIWARQGHLHVKPRSLIPWKICRRQGFHTPVPWINEEHSEWGVRKLQQYPDHSWVRENSWTHFTCWSWDFRLRNMTAHRQKQLRSVVQQITPLVWMMKSLLRNFYSIE